MTDSRNRNTARRSSRLSQGPTVPRGTCGKVATERAWNQAEFCMVKRKMVKNQGHFTLKIL